MIVYINGQFVEQEKAQISVWDIGLLRGYGGFEFLRTYHGKLFHLQDHMQRLQKTLDTLEIAYCVSCSSMQNIIEALLEKNRFQDAFIKILVTGGASQNHTTPLSFSSPTVIVMTYPPYPFDPASYTKGVSAITYPAVRELNEIKSLNYTIATMARKKALEKNAAEAIYIDQNGFLYEGAFSNVFFCKNDQIITAEEKILQGITRNIVLDLAHSLYKIEKRRLHQKELVDVKEAFITSTSQKIVPLSGINQMQLSAPGPITTHLMQLFSSYIDQTVKKVGC